MDKEIRLPHKNPCIPSISTLAAVLFGWVTMVMSTAIVHIVCQIAGVIIMPNPVFWAAIGISLIFIWMPHNHALFENANLAEYIRHLEKKNKVEQSTTMWLYFYYIVLGNYYGQHLYFYMRILTGVVLSTIAYFYLSHTWLGSVSILTIGIFSSIITGTYWIITLCYCGNCERLEISKDEKSRGLWL